jgi:hypothetical protein
MRISEITLSPHKTHLPTEFDQLETEIAELNKLLNASVDEYYMATDVHERVKVKDKQAQLSAQIGALKQQLTQLHASDQSPQAESWLDKIEQECGEFVKICQKVQVFLMSGMKDYSVSALEGRSRMYRRPTDSEPDLSNQFDEYLTQMGITALRSNSLFTTTDFDQADTYGAVFLIFPKDHKYTFSYTAEKDITLDSQDAHKLESLETFKKYFAPTQNNIADAMTDGVEILINGEYIAIKARAYKKMVARRWGVHVFLR